MNDNSNTPMRNIIRFFRFVTEMRRQCVSINACCSINSTNAHARLQIATNCEALVVYRSECERYNIVNMFVEYKDMQMNRAQTNGGSRLREHCIFAYFVANFCMVNYFSLHHQRSVGLSIHFWIYFVNNLSLVWTNCAETICLKLNRPCILNWVLDIWEFRNRKVRTQKIYIEI